MSGITFKVCNKCKFTILFDGHCSFCDGLNRINKKYNNQVSSD